MGEEGRREGGGGKEEGRPRVRKGMVWGRVVGTAEWEVGVGAVSDSTSLARPPATKRFIFLTIVTLVRGGAKSQEQDRSASKGRSSVTLAARHSSTKKVQQKLAA